MTSSHGRGLYWGGAGRMMSAILLAILVPLSAMSCRRVEVVERIDLPSTPVLGMQTMWAVIGSSHLRLRERPSVKSAAITTLWRGYVLEVVSKRNNTETVEGATDHWYQISYDGLQGWVFGGYLELYDSRERATEAARAMDK